jgi:hypothetical protein
MYTFKKLLGGLTEVKKVARGRLFYLRHPSPPLFKVYIVNYHRGRTHGISMSALGVNHLSICCNNMLFSNRCFWKYAHLTKFGLTGFPEIKFYLHGKPAFRAGIGNLRYP